MAERVPKAGVVAARESHSPAAQAAGEADLAILFPDNVIEIAGRRVVIREYRFGESMDVLRIAAPLIQSIAESAEEVPPTWASVRPHLHQHKDIVLQISALAGDVEPEWLADLTRAQGELYQQVWFSVNCRFFMQEVALLMVEHQRRLRLSGGQTSSSPLLVPDSETPPSSSGSPNASWSSSTSE